MIVPLALITSAAFVTVASVYYVAPKTPFAVPIVAACCGTFALASAVLLPADAASGGGARWPGLVAFWRALYWAALLLGVLATHTLCELLVAGEFSRVGRVRAAVRASLRLYALVVACTLAGCLYMLFWLNVSLSELPAVVTLLVNGYGMVLLALLQGRGLVMVPRQMWRLAAPSAELARCYFALAAAADARDATAAKLKELLHKVDAADTAAPPSSRTEREAQCWDGLHRSCRVASEQCLLQEHEGGALESGLRSAWAHTVGRPRARDQVSLAKLRRRVRVSGALAR